MIVAEAIGGLGNQMFQYAAAKSLADRLNTNFCIDSSAFVEYDRHAFELGDLNLALNIFDNSKYEVTSRPKSFVDKLLSVGGKLETKNLKLYVEKGMAYDPEFAKLRDNTYLRGYFQSEKYFGGIAKQLLDEFAPKKVGRFTEKVTKDIRSQHTSVSLHIRRGDYVSNKSANEYHGVMGLEYYAAAIARITQSAPKHTIVVFSDDIEWCKNNLPIKGKPIWIDGGHSSIEGIYMMAQCSHNIIANSSFSWWGAWLNTNKDKTVVAPKKWFSDPLIDTSDVVPKSWQRI